MKIYTNSNAVTKPKEIENKKKLLIKTVVSENRILLKSIQKLPNRQQKTDV